MKHLNKSLAILAALFISTIPSLFAEKTKVDNLYEYKLENGLTVFEAENHAVPLVYIEIAVKAGAKDQTPETAGLFHLYEHMMFKGNALYPDAQSVQKALTELGVANWNGTTGIDRVNYYFTIPSDRIEEGLAFWNAAIRSPNMDKREFENEKKVVLSEIQGDSSDPSHIYLDSIDNELFSDGPYRVSPGGSISSVKGASIAQLYDIKDRFYIPSNSALFIGGDIDPEETFELVKKIWGSWSDNGKEVPQAQKQMKSLALEKPTAIVLPYDQMSNQVANVTVFFRGPDTDFDINDTYAADYFCQLASDPDGIYVQDLVADEDLMIPGSEYVWQSYQTVRQNGTVQFGATMLNPQENLPQRSMKMLEDLQSEILPKIAADKNLFSKEKVKSIAQYLRDQDEIASDTAMGLLTNLRFWWLATSTDYYYSYNEKISQVTQKDMQDFFNKYFFNKNALVAILVNPSIYEATKAEYEKLGFKVATTETASWWNNPKYAIDENKIAQVNADFEANKKNRPKENIYIPNPSQNSNQNKKIVSIVDGVKELKLNNGIKVYLKKDDSKKLSTVQIVTKSGLQHLTKETSGLEAALFNIMASSSKNYDFSKRQSLDFKTQSSINYDNMPDGSILSLVSLTSHLDEMLPVLVDGFLNPEFNQQVYDNMMTNASNNVQRQLNDPQSLLEYTVDNEIYKNHPYDVKTQVTPDSIENITIENMKKLHKVLIDPSNIFVVAVGNMDEEKLISFLNKNLGRIKISSLSSIPTKKVTKVEITNEEPVILTNPSIANSGYVIRVFDCPSIDSDEYISACLAAEIYSSLMFTVVRENHGVCYTPISSVIPSRASVGCDILISLSDYENFSFAMDTSSQLMALGMIVNGTNPGGSYSFDPLETILESSKNKFINSSYYSQTTTASVATKISKNLLNYNDMAHGEKNLEKLRSTSASDIKKVFKKYWIESPSRWFVIVGPDDKDKLIFKE